jgi:hypothetical protein
MTRPAVFGPDGPTTPQCATRPDKVFGTHRVSTLDIQWTAILSTAGAFLGPCGRWLCIVDQDGVHAIVPDTGAPAWTMPNTPQFTTWPAGSTKAPTSPTRATLSASTRDAARGPQPESLADHPRTVEHRAGCDDNSATRLDRRLARRTGPGPRVDILGAVTQVSQDSCQVDDGYLACLAINNELRIGRYGR